MDLEIPKRNELENMKLSSYVDKFYSQPLQMYTEVYVVCSSNIFK